MDSNTLKVIKKPIKINDPIRYPLVIEEYEKEFMEDWNNMLGSTVISVAKKLKGFTDGRTTKITPNS
jgi:hypothetical protein